MSDPQSHPGLTNLTGQPAAIPPVKVVPEPPKPWWQSSTITCAGIAGVAAAVSGALQAGTFNAFLPAADIQGIGFVCDGLALLFSGGAIRGRFTAIAPLK